MKSIKLKLVSIISILIVVVISIQGMINLQITKKQLRQQAKDFVYLQANQLSESLTDMEHSIDSLEKEIFHKHSNILKKKVKDAINITNYYYNRYKAGYLTEEEAKQKTIDVLKDLQNLEEDKLHVNNNEYEFLLYPELQDINDVDGNKVFESIVNNSKSEKELILDYNISESNQKKENKKKQVIISKRAYAEYFEPWGWTISSNTDISKARNEITKYKKEQQQRFYQKIKKLSKGAMVAVMDSRGKLLYHVKKTSVGKRMGLRDSNTGVDIVGKMLKVKNDYMDYTVKDPVKKIDVARIGYIKYEKNKDRYILIAKDKKDVFKAVDKISQISLVLLIGFVILSIIASYVLSHSFTKPILKLKDISQKVSMGDLSCEVSLKKRKDEIGQLGQAFNKMIKNLRSLTSSSKDVSLKVEQTSEVLAEMIGETSTAIEQVSIAVEDIANGASKQTNYTEEGVKKVDILEDTTDTIRKDAEDMHNSVNEMREMSKQGEQIVEDLMAKQDISKRSISKIDEVIKVLGKQTDTISEFTDTIAGIAKETNLLALNASIEAARAGEAGKGFAVVAQEISKLAEESSASANEIQEIVSKIHNDTKETIEFVIDAKEASEEQDNTVKNTDIIFKKLGDAVCSSIKKIENVYNEIQSLDEVKTGVVEIVENIYAVSEDTAASTEEVSASVEEQSASMEEINSYVKELANKAHELKSSIEKFKM